MTYKCEHFHIYELVPKEVYEERGEKAWQLLDDRILMFADFLREEWGPATINDWYWGGANQWRGLRTYDSPYYSKYSQHTFGRALDVIFKEVDAEAVRRWLDDNDYIWKGKGITFSITVEEDVTWLHIDVRNNEQGFNSFHP